MLRSIVLQSFFLHFSFLCAWGGSIVKYGEIPIHECSQHKLKHRVDCLATDLEKKIFKCTDKDQLRNLKFELKGKCVGYPGMLGVAEIGGSSFELCGDVITRSLSEVSSKYREKYDSKKAHDIALYINNLAIQYSMVHEAFHLLKFDHSVEMDETVEKHLQCAGIRPVFSEYGTWADWTREF